MPIAMLNENRWVVNIILLQELSDNERGQDVAICCAKLDRLPFELQLIWRHGESELLVVSRLCKGLSISLTLECAEGS